MSPHSNQYSHIEVLAEGILPVIKGMRAKALAKVLLAKHDLEDVREGQLYPQKNYLSLLDDIEIKMPGVLRNIGKAMMSQAIFPPNIKSFEEVLMVTDQAYYMNHRGAKKGEIGHYNCEKISEKVFLMSVSCPYPCIFDQGIILGMAEKFQVRVSIEHEDETCRSKGDPQCNYRIEIKS